MTNVLIGLIGVCGLVVCMFALLMRYNIPIGFLKEFEKKYRESIKTRDKELEEEKLNRELRKMKDIEKKEKVFPSFHL